MNYISCGGMNIPGELASISRIFYSLIMIVVPIGLIVLGSKDILSAVTGSDEKAIKKARDKFFKRLISAGVIFFVFTIVSLLITLLSANSESKSYTKCISCLISDEKSCDDSSWNTADEENTEAKIEIDSDKNDDKDSDSDTETRDGAGGERGGRSGSF